MLKLLQKLSELSGETTKQSVLLENELPVEECGTMGSMGSMGAMSSAPRTPASINITASSGPELSSMLKDIMSLAGVHQVTPDHMPAIKSTEPTIKLGSHLDMRKMLDSMNNDDQEQVEAYDNTPADPTDIPDFDSEEHAYNPNTGDHTPRQAGLALAMPVKKSTVESIHNELFVEYQKFIQ